MTDVTVVIPTHNRLRLLPATLACALAQRGVDLEVVVVDDGSTDGTQQWLDGLDDPRLVVVRHDVPQRVAAARNAGIARASGRFIAFLDDDDLWAPDKLRHQLDAVAGGAKWAVSTVVVVDDTLTVGAAGHLAAGAMLAERLGWENSVPAGSSNVLVATEALAAVGGFDPLLRHFADWDMWIRLARLGPPATVADPDVAYRTHSANASSSSRDSIDELHLIADRCADLRGGAEIDERWVYRWIGWWSLLAGRRADATWAYLHAVRRGDVRSLGRLAVAIAGPRLGAPLLRRPVDAELATKAAAWLRTHEAGGAQRQLGGESVDV